VSAWLCGLPSTTAVGQRLPKEAFYKNLSLSAAQRREFVDGIESIEVAASVKEATVHVPPARGVDEVMLLAVGLKATLLPALALDAVAAQNPHKLVFACCAQGEGGPVCCLAVRRLGALRRGTWLPRESCELALHGADLADIWDALCAQVLFGDADGSTVDGRLRARERAAELTEKLAKLNKRLARETQTVRRNSLFTEKQALEAELAHLEQGV
jgi:hypothetical protein